ncbi:hypothetical protein EON68_00280 [archaeon]|nr:MAG: hypothetical protein EON68_00280 [archaeon]
MSAGTKDSAKAAAERRGSAATAGVDDAPPPCSSAATWQSLHAGGGADMGAGPTSVPCFALLPQDVFADLTNYLSLPDILTLRASCAANVYLCNEVRARGSHHLPAVGPHAAHQIDSLACACVCARVHCSCRIGRRCTSDCVTRMRPRCMHSLRRTTLAHSHPYQL